MKITVGQKYIMLDYVCPALQGKKKMLLLLVRGHFIVGLSLYFSVHIMAQYFVIQKKPTTCIVELKSESQYQLNDSNWPLNKGCERCIFLTNVNVLLLQDNMFQLRHSF